MPQTPSPGAASGPVRVLRVQTDVPTIVLFLGPLQGHLEHWNGKRSVACPGSDECDKSIHRLRTIFYAYAPVGHFNGQTGCCEPAVLQVTAFLEEQLRGRQLRGQVWSLSRDDARGKTGKVSALFIEQRSPTNIPPAFPVEPPLLRLFNVAKLRLGVRNPNPDPLIIESFEVEPLRLGRLGEALEPEKPPTPEQMERLRAQFRRGPAGNGRK